MTEHVLKCDRIFFEAVEDGRKPFESRYNDRGYQTGDTLILECWDAALRGYVFNDNHKIRTLKRRVTWMLTGGQFGVESGWVVMGLAEEANGDPDQGDDPTLENEPKQDLAADLDAAIKSGPPTDPNQLELDALLKGAITTESVGAAIDNQTAHKHDEDDSEIPF